MRNFDKLIIALFIITLIAVFSAEKILQKTINITPKTVIFYTAYADEASGGNSKLNVLANPDAYHWTCKIKNSSIAHPFCGFELSLSHDREEGIDLSNFNRIKLWLTYKGEAKSVRLFMRNNETNYTETADYTSTKYNSLEINTDHLSPGLELEFRYFNVPSWWQLERRLSPAQMAPEFYNIISLDIQTASDANDGKHEFIFEKAELHGQWISTEKWYFGILILWMTLITFKVVHHQVQLLRKIESGSERELELRKINAHLDEQGRKLQEKVETDKLTGAFNRAGAELKLSDALQEKQKDGFIFSIILLDIDHFKKINDTYGHDCGDVILKTFSAVLRKMMRENDVICRYGGEEFVALISYKDEEEVINYIDRVKSVVVKHKFVYTSDIKLKVRFSAGVSYRNKYNSYEDAIKYADILLYKAKHEGKDKVIFDSGLIV